MKLEEKLTENQEIEKYNGIVLLQTAFCIRTSENDGPLQASCGLGASLRRPSLNLRRAPRLGFFLVESCLTLYVRRVSAG